MQRNIFIPIIFILVKRNYSWALHISYNTKEGQKTVQIHTGHIIWQLIQESLF